MSREETDAQGMFLWITLVSCLIAAVATQDNNNSKDYNNVSREQLEDFGAVDVPQLATSVVDKPPRTEATKHVFKSLASRARTVDFYSNPPTADGFAGQSLPIFDFGMPRNISRRTGSEAVIKCRVDSLHDKSVSWIRKRDLHILTVGTATYTSDKRFQVTESKDTREWTLHVKSPRPKDSGIYECQVNTEPKMSMGFQLNIIEISPDAKAFISGPPDLHFKVGSAIILNCLVKQPSVKDIGPIFWYRGEHMIAPMEPDEGDAEPQTHQMKGKPEQQDQFELLNEVLSTDLQKDFETRIAMESQLGDSLKSRLRIFNAQITDTGNYTCQPTTASSASVLVHVINDENPAAMQKSTAVSLCSKESQQRLGLVLLSVLAIHRTKYLMTNTICS